MRSFDVPTAIVVAGAFLLVLLAGWLQRRLRRRGFISAVDHATYETLHRASLAGRHLTEGLTPEAGTKAGKHLLALLGARALAISDTGEVVSWVGPGEQHRRSTMALIAPTLTSGRTAVADYRVVHCSDPNCLIEAAVSAPLVSDERVIGAITAYTDHASAGLARATEEVAQWFSAQLELAEVGRDRSRPTSASSSCAENHCATSSVARARPAEAWSVYAVIAPMTRSSLTSGALTAASMRQFGSEQWTTR